MRQRFSIFLLMMTVGALGCTSKTIVEAANVDEIGGYRLRNDKIEVIVSPTLARVISIRPIGFQPVRDDRPTTTALPSDLNDSSTFRVVSASDGKLVIESIPLKTNLVTIRRIYRLENDQLIIETAVRPARDGSSGSR